MRRAARVDVNHEAIVLAFRGLGCSVETLHRVGQGVPDLLVGLEAGNVQMNLLVEVKRDDAGPAKRELSPEQSEWVAKWRGQVAVVRNLEDVGRLVKAVRAIRWEAR